MCLSNFLKIVTACPFGGNSLKIKVYFCFLLQANASLISHKELSTSLLWKSFHLLLCLANSLCLQPWWGKYSFLGTGKSMVCSFLQWWICWESYCFLIKLLLLASYTQVIWVRFFLSLCVRVCMCVQVMSSICPRLALPVNIHTWWNSKLIWLNCKSIQKILKKILLVSQNLYVASSGPI